MIQLHADAPPSARGGGPPRPDDPARSAILVVDDEEAVRNVLSRFLASRGFRVETAPSGPAALDLLSRTPFALAICDVRMPGMSGTEVVQEALRLDADLAIVMLTSATDAATAAKAFTSGAMDYLAKPLGLPLLEQAIERALRRRRHKREQQWIDRMVREEVELQADRLRTMSVSVVESLVNAMEARSIYLRGHSQRTAALGAAIAQALRLPPETVEQVGLAGRLHDVGQIGVRESVLNKPDVLTVEEYDEVKAHVRIGMEILAPLTHLGPVLAFVQDHHERWDGGGYPRGLAGPAISVGGRILAAADAFDALTSERAYRDSVAGAEALDILASRSGSLLDPECFAALRQVVESGGWRAAIGVTQG